MKHIEKLLGLIFILAFLNKIYVSNPHSTWLLLALVGLLSLYFYLGFALFNDIGFRDLFKKATFENIRRKRIYMAIAYGITFSTILTGVLFVVLMWVGGQEMLFIGLSSLLILALFHLRNFWCKVNCNLRII